MMRLWCWPVVLGGLFACSSQKPEPATPAPQTVPKPNSAVPSPNEPSDALRAIAPEASFVLRLLGDELRQGPVLDAIDALKQSIAELRQGLVIVQAGCGFDPVQAIEELVIGAEHQHQAHPEEPLGRIRLDPETLTAALLLDRPAEDALRCLGNFVPAEKTQVGEHPALVLPTGGVLVARHELLVYTPKGLAESAGQRIDKAAPLAPELQATLDGNRDAAALIYARGSNALGVNWASLALSQPGGGLVLTGTGRAENERAASELVDQLVAQVAKAQSVLRQEVDSPQAEALAELLGQVRIAHNGPSLSLKFQLDKARAEKLVSEVLVGLAQQGVSRYQSAAKTAEARDNVMRIALALSDHARARKPPAPRFPPSAPLSPPHVPKGQPVQSPPGFEHPSWKAIGFAPEEPVLYAYEFVTAPDGKSVEVIARGDLDGDGKQSRYGIRVTLEGSEPKIDSRLTREEPYE